VSARKRVVLHIGTHKTGTTSIQRFLRDHEELLRAAGVVFPPGLLRDANHMELHMLAMRAGRESPARRAHPDAAGPAWEASAREHVRRAVAEATADTVVLSAEGLWFLRHDDEMTRLRDLFGEHDVEVVVLVRDATSFLASYARTLDELGIARSGDPASVAYVESDSWLVDVDGNLARWRAAFGADRVTVLDYDACVRADGSVIPAFLERLGIARSRLPDVSGYYVNRRTPRDADR
jgi:hypothetical protein